MGKSVTHLTSKTNKVKRERGRERKRERERERERRKGRNKKEGKCDHDVFRTEVLSLQPVNYISSQNMV